MRPTVVLPQPDSPTSPRVSPLLREKDTSSTAFKGFVGCVTCVLVCPYGALAPGEDGIMQKCELCLENACGTPACVAGCPNKAIVYEERGDTV